MRLFKFNAILKTIANFNVEYIVAIAIDERCRITEYNKLLVHKLWFYGYIRFVILFAVVFTKWIQKKIIDNVPLNMCIEQRFTRIGQQA